MIIKEIPFQELINKAVRGEEREKKEITSWHISKLGGCLRGTYLERLGKEPDTPFDDRTLRVFRCGNIFEDWLINLLKERKEVKVETQVRVEDEKLNVSGYVDAKVEYNGITKLYEVKTKHSRAFWWMKKEGKPMRQHEYQLWTYLYLTGIEEGALVYLSKDDLAILEFPVYLKDKELKKEVMERIDLLNKAWKVKDISLLPLPKKGSWQEKYCRWHRQCVVSGLIKEAKKTI